MAKNIHKLKNAQILLVGLGGVGSYAGEFLVRAGIGSLIIIDGDRVDPTNINRQMQALHSTIGMSKAELLRQRFLDINPGLQIEIHTSFMEPADMELLLQQVEIDFVLDCIDSVLPKLTLIKAAVKLKSVISAMGAGGKFSPQSQGC